LFRFRERLERLRSFFKGENIVCAPFSPS